VLDELIGMQLIADQGEKDGCENDPESARGSQVTRMRDCWRMRNRRNI
jgi:hypothetical protein